MLLDNVIPEVKFTSAELHEIATAINSPSLRKYLINQQRQFVQDIVNGAPRETDAAESYLRKHMRAQGGLAVLEDLLSIEKPQNPFPSI